MLVMNYSQARQNLASLLDQVKKDGEAFITRADGSRFRVLNDDDGADDFSSPFSELASYAKTAGSSMSQIPLNDFFTMLREDEDIRTDRIIACSQGKRAADYFNVLNR